VPKERIDCGERESLTSAEREELTYLQSASRCPPNASCPNIAWPWRIHGGQPVSHYPWMARQEAQKFCGSHSMRSSGDHPPGVLRLASSGHSRSRSSPSRARSCDPCNRHRAPRYLRKPGSPVSSTIPPKNLWWGALRQMIAQVALDSYDQFKIGELVTLLLRQHDPGARVGLDKILRHSTFITRTEMQSSAHVVLHPARH